MSSLRGRAAIVGVADAVSPTGELEGSVRALEVRMIREALVAGHLSKGGGRRIIEKSGGNLGVGLAFEAQNAVIAVGYFFEVLCVEGQELIIDGKNFPLCAYLACAFLCR